MRLALLGGTGDVGEGLALRWARDTDHEVVVGSRKAAKAEARAAGYREELADRGVDADLRGTDNAAAAEAAEVVVLSVPPGYAADTVGAVGDGLDRGDVLVSPAVSMDRDGAGFHYDRPEAGSVAQAVAAAAPEGVPVVGAFQNVAAGALADLGHELDVDIVVTGDDPEATELVAELAGAIDGLRALQGGPLAVTAEVEAITPLLINLAMNNDGMHDLGVRFQ